MSKEREEERAFRVEDHRRFDAEGRPRPEARPEAEPAKACAEASLPDIDFSTFILSLVTSAMVHLGEAPDPEGKVRKDLALAKQSIDILGLLRDKTAGNLTPEESRLIEEVLFDLRLRYCGCLGR
jgi:hypothetical protein